jgi:hypothetical protein
MLAIRVQLRRWLDPQAHQLPEVMPNRLSRSIAVGAGKVPSPRSFLTLVLPRIASTFSAAAANTNGPSPDDTTVISTRIRPVQTAVIEIVLLMNCLQVIYYYDGRATSPGSRFHDYYETDRKCKYDDILVWRNWLFVSVDVGHGSE